MWESQSDFQGQWEERETVLGFSSLSTARHFNGRFRPVKQGALSGKSYGTKCIWRLACGAPTRCR